jgi:hypothetical protein
MMRIQKAKNIYSNCGYSWTLFGQKFDFIVPWQNFKDNNTYEVYGISFESLMLLTNKKLFYGNKSTC